MKLIRVGKPYSWLQYPVHTIGCSIELHVTVKFFGKANINPDYVNAAVGALDLKPNVGDMIWHPALFSSAKDPSVFDVHVLVLEKCPAVIEAVHDLFGVIRDQHTPFRPHITVPKEYWVKVMNERLTPQAQRLQFKELELCIGDT